MGMLSEIETGFVDSTRSEVARRYEAEESVRPDDQALFGALWDATTSLLTENPGATLLDVCAGTGLALSGVRTLHLASEVRCVDIDPVALQVARTKLQCCCHAKFEIADVVNSDFGGQKFDIITMSFAYHHIPDRLKGALLANVRRALKTGGTILISENILPPYRAMNSKSYGDAVHAFYSQVVQDAESAATVTGADITTELRDILRNRRDGDDEFKVDIERLLVDLERAAIEVRDVRKVWPHRGPLSMTSGGNYLLVCG